ncbi:hypothetical protein DEO72_LG7g1295 [Vigna unguiculata]|uniref:Uncharacterized protein n=1 Tax=Vigna unguiculata TaxID=3917 RepID=A0A4D6MIG7_VIGUN|nr:hypothetical protein DEO72_LG7g1295 [Vigna unguiculata]
MGTMAFCAISLKRDPLHLSETSSRSKEGFGRLSDNSRGKAWASLCSSCLGETSSLGRDYRCLPLFAPALAICICQTKITKQSKHAQQHTNSQIMKPKIARATSTPDKEVLGSFTWIELAQDLGTNYGAHQL